MELMRCAVGLCGSHPVIPDGERAGIDLKGFPDLSLYLELSHFFAGLAQLQGIYIGWYIQS